MINRFEDTTALKCLDQRKYYVTVFTSNICKLNHLGHFNYFSLLVISEAETGPLPASKFEVFVMIVNGMEQWY